MDELQRFYLLLSTLPAELGLAVVRGLEGLLRRPKRRFEAAPAGLGWVLVVLENPALFRPGSSSSQSSGSVLKRFLGIVSNLPNEAHHYVGPFAGRLRPRPVRPLTPRALPAPSWSAGSTSSTTPRASSARSSSSTSPSSRASASTPLPSPRRPTARATSPCPTRTTGASARPRASCHSSLRPTPTGLACPSRPSTSRSPTTWTPCSTTRVRRALPALPLAAEDAGD